ncbi:MAG: type VI secretion system tip protein TssI/VgrG [Myxococcota bacterium]
MSAAETGEGSELAAKVEARVHSAAVDLGVYRVTQLTYREAISELYRLEAVLVPRQKGEVEPAVLHRDELMGAPARVELMLGGNVVRTIFGAISEVGFFSLDDDAQPSFRIVLTPRIWVGNLVHQSDLHVDRTIVEVLRSKLEWLGLDEGSDFELKLEQAYDPREITLQYRESDFQFISRLMEHYGICYVIQHEDGRERMKLHDATLEYGYPDSFEYKRRGDEAGIHQLEGTRIAVPRTYVCRDYNDQLPTLEIHEEYALEDGYGGAVIDTASHVPHPEAATRMALIRAEEWLNRRETFTGESTIIELEAGRTFELGGFPLALPPLLVVAVEHVIAADGEYHNRFWATAGGTAYRPPRTTPVPRIVGTVTGIVETIQGSFEKYAKLDDQGRYRVRFLFDTAPPDERPASCWIRMVQPSAGQGHGMHFPLQPGVEVQVGFVDGSPDRPLIVGAVPNPVTGSPVDGRERTKSRIKTSSGIIIEFDDATRAPHP